MVDIAFGPEPGKRPDLSVSNTRYLEMVRRKRMYGGILLVFFIALMAAGWMLAEERNAGDFWSGLPQVIDFPAEVLTEAWMNRANIAGYAWEHFPSLIETINIAAVATLTGLSPPCSFPCLPRAGLRAGPA
jgi:phosphonate transport system permease protein